jgi:glycerol dehydrogenase-like iron-containing ADH family enzyme
LFTNILHGRDNSDLINLFQRTGMPVSPNALRISKKVFLQAIKNAPNTRKERFTVLNITSEKQIEDGLISAYGKDNL